ncbi:amiloride-sensitive sodium channel subunit gamma-like [Mya arenaria]|uniref:amiloride-sensitive sodium channel subunit gamma-like n=1 Tax=Mya arenaria TaxID=6604 RepID=UPI0022DEB4CE|nr:amiloride-sensitive sodium channel subunit gamma-like [Mya arenaria]
MGKKTWILPVEVGCRGFQSQSVWKMLGAVGIKERVRKIAVHALGRAAERASSSGYDAVNQLGSQRRRGAAAVFSVQMVGLFREYFSYPTKTSVSMQFSQLAFPALTFCNMNQIRQSSNWYEYQELYEIYQTSWHQNMVNNANFTIDDLKSWGMPEDDAQALLIDFQNARDSYEAWKSRILFQLRNISKEERFSIGHKADVFIHSTTIAGYFLESKAYDVIQSASYGNCFTLDSSSMIARGTGQSHALSIVFNIERYEYFKQSSSAFGVRMVLHEKGTLPLPESEGLTLNTAFETNVGIRQVSIERLGGRYGDCTNGESFVDKYNSSYTVPVCYVVCEAEHMASECGCIPLNTPESIPLDMPICDVDDISVRNCSTEVKNYIYKGDLTCDCKTPCKQTVYTTTLSGRSWPHDEYLKNVILEDICGRNNSAYDGYYKYTNKFCDKQANDTLTAAELEEIAGNFISVNIYFEDLNYEKISEEALYNTIRFLSDIGGAMGFYMGASLLTYVEILQVIPEMIILFCSRKKASVNPK